MNGEQELLARCWHWLADLGYRAHMIGCRGSPMLPDDQRQPCNCGLASLQQAISEATAAPRDTNGHGGEIHP